MRAANAKRFMELCVREFAAFKKERLASGELECQKLINAAQAHLTQVLFGPRLCPAQSFQRSERVRFDHMLISEG